MKKSLKRGILSNTLTGFFKSSCITAVPCGRACKGLKVVTTYNLLDVDNRPQKWVILAQASQPASSAWGGVGECAASWGSRTLLNGDNHGPASEQARGFTFLSFLAMAKNRYFYFDEATDTAIELLDQGPRRLAQMVALIAGLLIIASFFL